MLANYSVSFSWDDEAEVWIATSDEIHGLILEGESLDTLMARVKEAIPELLEYESHTSKNIALDFSATRSERLVLHG